MANSCATCFFGQRFQSVSGQLTRVCCANAPYALAFTPGPASVLGVVQHLWPPVLDTDWCGEGIDVGSGEPFTPTLVTWPWNKVLFYGSTSFYVDPLQVLSLGAIYGPLPGAGQLSVDCFSIPVYVEAGLDGEGAIQNDTVLWGMISAELDSTSALQADTAALDMVYAAMNGEGI